MTPELHRARVHLKAPWSDEQTRALMEALPRLKRRRDTRRGIVTGTATALVVLLLVLVVPHHTHVPPAIAAQAPTPSWSMLSMTKETQLAPPRVSADRVVVQLERGIAHFAIEPRPDEPRRVLRIELQQVAIEVMAAEFTVDNRGARVFVSVEHGIALVKWDGGSAQLAAGHSALYPPVAPVPVAPVVVAPVVAAPTRAAIAKHRVHAQPVVAIAPTPETTPQVDEVEQLLGRADVARLAHQPFDAIAPLQRVLQHHGDDPRASLAAFMLGRVLLDELGRPREAAEAFAEAQRHGTLVAEALAREVEALARSGQHDLARRRAQAYVTRYPDGQRIVLVRKLGGLD